MVDASQNSNTSLPASGGSPWWKPAMQVFGEVSTWIAGPAILGAVGGSWLDKHYGTKPTFLIICSVVAFAVSIHGIFKTIKKYGDKLKDSIKNQE